MIIRNGSIICEGYECDQKAVTKTHVGNKYYCMCELHRNCLNHPTTETILSMISTGKFTYDSLKLNFNFDICDFSWDNVLDTAKSLVNLGHVDVNDGVLLVKDIENRCEFPGCSGKLHTNNYCFQHRNMPPVNIILKCISESKIRPVTILSASEIVGTSSMKTRTFLARLVGSGIMRSYKIGLKMFYEAM